MLESERVVRQRLVRLGLLTVAALVVRVTGTARVQLLQERHIGHVPGTQALLVKQSQESHIVLQDKTEVMLLK